MHAYYVPPPTHPPPPLAGQGVPVGGGGRQALGAGDQDQPRRPGQQNTEQQLVGEGGVCTRVAAGEAGQARGRAGGSRAEQRQVDRCAGRPCGVQAGRRGSPEGREASARHQAANPCCLCLDTAAAARLPPCRQGVGGDGPGVDCGQPAAPGAASPRNRWVGRGSANGWGSRTDWAAQAGASITCAEGTLGLSTPGGPLHQVPFATASAPGWWQRQRSDTRAPHF